MFLSSNTNVFYLMVGQCSLNVAYPRTSLHVMYDHILFLPRKLKPRECNKKKKKAKIQSSYHKKCMKMGGNSLWRNCWVQISCFNVTVPALQYGNRSHVSNVTGMQGCHSVVLIVLWLMLWSLSGASLKVTGFGHGAGWLHLSGNILWNWGLTSWVEPSLHLS